MVDAMDKRHRGINLHACSQAGPVRRWRVLMSIMGLSFAGASYAVELPPPDSPPVVAAPTISEVTSATKAAEPEAWNLHGQATFVEQGHPSFRSPYQGANSLTPARNAEETADLTLSAGVRLWQGAAFYINPDWAWEAPRAAKPTKSGSGIPMDACSERSCGSESTSEEKARRSAWGPTSLVARFPQTT